MTKCTGQEDFHTGTQIRTVGQAGRASSVHLQEFGTDVIDAGRRGKKYYKYKLNCVFVQPIVRVDHTSRIMTED